MSTQLPTRAGIVPTPVGTELSSTGTVPPVDSDMAQLSLRSLTRDYRVVLSLSSVIEDEPSGLELKIEGLTYTEGSGIFQQLSATGLRIASQGRSHGG